MKKADVFLLLLTFAGKGYGQDFFFKEEEPAALENSELSVLDAELKSILSLFSGGNSQGRLRAQCLDKRKWGAFVFSNVSYTAIASIGSRCDFTGRFSPKTKQFFPVSFSVNPKKTDIRRFSGKLKITKQISPASSYVSVRFQIREGELSFTGGEIAQFNAHYDIVVNPLTGRTPASLSSENGNNIGGSYNLYYYKGKNLNVKRKISLANEYLF